MASHNVSALTNRMLEVPPIPVETVRKQDNNQLDSPDQKVPKGFRLPKNVVEIFEIWKVFVEREKDELNESFVVISANLITEGYKQGDWQDIEYRGFYTTFEEAKNEINGYLR